MSLVPYDIQYDKVYVLPSRSRDTILLDAGPERNEFL